MHGWQWLHQQIHDYRLKRATIAVVNAKQGYAARTWPLPATDAERLQLAEQIRDWLALQITGTATPYGYSEYNIGLALAVGVNEQRQALWYELQPGFKRLQTQDGIDAAYQRLLTAPFVDHPTATHIEAYLLSWGDIFKQAYTNMGYK